MNFDFSVDFSLTYCLLTVASFRIGVPSILFITETPECQKSWWVKAFVIVITPLQTYLVNMVGPYMFRRLCIKQHFLFALLQNDVGNFCIPIYFGTYCCSSTQKVDIGSTEQKTLQSRFFNFINRFFFQSSNHR